MIACGKQRNLVHIYQYPNGTILGRSIQLNKCLFLFAYGILHLINQLIFLNCHLAMEIAQPPKKSFDRSALPKTLSHNVDELAHCYTNEKTMAGVLRT